MSITIEQFWKEFPEFDKAPADFVLRYLARAALEVDVTVWGALAESGTMFLAAHKMAVTPFGRAAHLVGENNKKDKGSRDSTTYGTEYDRMKQQVSGGFRVTGGPTYTSGTIWY